MMYNDIDKVLKRIEGALEKFILHKLDHDQTKDQCQNEKADKPSSSNNINQGAGNTRNRNETTYEVQEIQVKSGELLVDLAC